MFRRSWGSKDVWRDSSAGKVHITQPEIAVNTGDLLWYLCIHAPCHMHVSVVDRSLAPVPWEDLDPTLVQEVQRESNGYTLDVLKDRLRPRDVVETTPGGDEYVLPDAAAPNVPCNVTNPHVVSQCGLSELPSSIHFEDETYHDAFFVQTRVEKVDHADYATPDKPLSSMSREEPLNNGLDPRSYAFRQYHQGTGMIFPTLLMYTLKLTAWTM